MTVRAIGRVADLSTIDYRRRSMFKNRTDNVSDACRALVIAAALFVIYNLNLRAIGAGDTMYMQYAALSIAAHGDTDLNEYRSKPGNAADAVVQQDIHNGPCDTPCLIARGLANGSLQERDGRVYSNYPVMTSLVAAPAYLLGLWTGFLDPAEADLFKLNAIGKLTASALSGAACGVLFLVLQRWKVAAPNMSIALAAGIATPLWSSASQSLWSHAPAAFCLGLGFLLISSNQRRSDVAAGIAFGVAVACRPLAVFFAVGAVIGFALEGRSAISRAFWIAVGTALVLVPLAIYHTVVFGTPAGGTAMLESPATHSEKLGIGIDGTFSGAILNGLSGVLFSPSRGLLIYSPIVILSLVGAALVWRDYRFERWILVIPVVGFMLMWGKFVVWWGGHTYGPRYAADLVIPLALLAAAAYARPVQRGRSQWATAFTMVLLLWSVSIQVVGAFFHPNGDWNSMPANVDLAHSRLWDWRDSQIVREIKAGPFVRHVEPLKDAISR